MITTIISKKVLNVKDKYVEPSYEFLDDLECDYIKQDGGFDKW